MRKADPPRHGHTGPRPPGRHLAAIMLGVAGLAASLAPAAAATVDDVKARGHIECGVGPSMPGFATVDAEGRWAGLYVAYCRALAAAIFNDVSKVRFQALPAQDGPAALTSGKVDLLSGVDIWTMTLDTGMKIKFAGTLFYDGQGFMVRDSSGATSVRDLGGASLCIVDGGYDEQNVSDYFAANNLTYTTVAAEDSAGAMAGYLSGQCDVVSDSVSRLAAARSRLADRDSHRILPEIAAKQPRALAVRVGEDDWLNLVRWVYFALLDAEELGVTSANVDQMLGSDNVEIKRLIGVEGDFGTPMGVSKDWVYQMVKLVGNYGEIFDRNVGPKTALGLARGLNALSKNGGLQFGPPIR